MVTVQTVLYHCAKFHNFPTSGSMGYHRLPERKKKKKKKKNRKPNGYNRCHRTFGAWPLIIIIVVNTGSVTRGSIVKSCKTVNHLECLKVMYKSTLIGNIRCWLGS